VYVYYIFFPIEINLLNLNISTSYTDIKMIRNSFSLKQKHIDLQHITRWRVRRAHSTTIHEKYLGAFYNANVSAKD
jgi:hypothetical protein